MITNKMGISTNRTKNGGGIVIAWVVELHESRTKGRIKSKGIQVTQSHWHLLLLDDTLTLHQIVNAIIDAVHFLVNIAR